MMPIAARGAFSIDPEAVYWRGEKIVLTKLRTRLLAKLVTLPRVSMTELCACGVSTRDALYAHITYVRAALPDGVTLVNRYGSGYVLEIEGDV